MKKIKTFVLATMLLLGFTSVAFGTEYAHAAKCGGATTAIIECTQDNKGNDIQNNGVWALLLIALNILVAGVGVLAIGGIVYAAILYTTAEDKADQVKQAQDMITNVVIGIVAFALMWVGLNFVIPGGVFS